MSKPPGKAASAVPDIDPTFIRFPPFPAVPEGVTIIPFKDFKECGLQVFNDDPEVELDGRGIPTVELPVKHATDESKTNAKKKRKKAAQVPLTNAYANNGVPQAKKEWWQTWEETEASRVYHYDS
jgi:hypothetical protein